MQKPDFARTDLSQLDGQGFAIPDREFPEAGKEL